MKRFAYLLPFFAGLAACGDRNAAWDDAPATTSLTVGLADRVVVIDDALHRALAIAPQADGSARFTTTTVGHTVTAAVAMDDAHRSRLAQALTGIYDRPVQINVVIDPAVVGGIRVQVGDEVVDGTILRRVQEAERALLR